ncbi:hypothetical protein C5B96_13860 [Subtercola sp. Z020]|uniref:mycothiol transferase n=1 Tax=Subtercola sp. Z020 TaxID=2080582 RepID=UPI000CE79856|nr:DinB family protein [Subtercola sp. Z020]PPF78914.1 hypothetical protein C5B96_13860 [Subtercola sp. Z020]
MTENTDTSASDILADSFTRVSGSVHSVLRGVTQADLAARVDPEANTIAWLVWHIARGQDAQVSALAETDELWTSDGWYEKFGVPFASSASGYGQSPADVAALDDIGADLLGGYFDAVHARTLEIVGSLDPAEFSRVVDDSYDPPVTLAARLVSVVNDCTQHVGQASFIKGFARRSRGAS